MSTQPKALRVILLRHSKRLRKTVNIRNRFLEGADQTISNNNFKRNLRRLAFGNANLVSLNLERLPEYEDIGDCERHW